MKKIWEFVKKYRLWLIIGLVFILTYTVLNLKSVDYTVSPVIFTIFGFDVVYYSLCIVLGIVLALLFALREIKILKIKEDDLYTGLFFGIIVGVIGARLWYVLFNLKEFDSLAEVIGIGTGGLAGLAIQGAIIVVLIYAVFFCRWKKINLNKCLDMLIPGLFIGQICGRWGNFFNHELYGRPFLGDINNGQFYFKILPKFITDNMYIKNGYEGTGYYQPMFLYELLLNLVGLIILLTLRKKWKKFEHGDGLAFYLVWYGLVRCLTESFRYSEERLEILNIPVSIVMSVIFIILGVGYFFFKRKYMARLLYCDSFAEYELYKKGIEPVVGDNEVIESNNTDNSTNKSSEDE